MEKFMKKIIWLIILAPGAYLAFKWNTVPETVAMHLNIKGEVDRYGSKNELITMVAILTFVNILVYVLLPQAYKIDPKKYAADNRSRLFRIAFTVSVFLAAVICLLIYSSINGNSVLGSKFMLMGIGLLFAIIGNYMYTIKPNYFAGFRLPWTLQDDENWRKTHMLGGKLFFAGGLLIGAMSLIAPFMISIIAFIAITVIIILVTTIYSYQFYKKQKTINLP